MAKTRATRRRTATATAKRTAKRTAKTTSRPSRRVSAKTVGAADTGAVSTGKAKTILYVHGIGNKPEESVLRCQWDHALLGFGLGERSRMAYWVQADRHGPPEPGTCSDADAIGMRALRLHGFGARAIAGAVEENRPLTEVVDEVADTPQEKAALGRLLAQMEDGKTGVPGTKGAKKVGAEGLGDIDFFDPVTRLISGLFLKDVADFFFDKTRRERMKDRLREVIAAGNGPFVIVAHSQGTMIAYSVLQELGTQVDVAQLVTIGSPLGLAEVQNQLRTINGLPKGKLPVPAGVRQWCNVFDKRDPVAQRERLSQHFSGDVMPVDTELDNLDSPADPHSATGYLKLSTVRTAVRENIDLQRFQRLAPFRLAADVAAGFERAAREERCPLLIELTDPVWAQSKRASLPPADRNKPVPEDRAQMATHVVSLITKVTGRKAGDEELAIQRLSRYVSVKLTQEEARRLASDDELHALGLALPPLYRIWRNARKFALLDKSINLVQAAPAHQAYKATGKGIQWAVLDSGCTPHPHFDTYDTIVARWDCTKVSDTPVWDKVLMEGPGRARKSTEKGLDKGPTRDQFGHGTHVAGIIAGAHTFPAGSAPAELSGIAPHTKLHIYKVLDRHGQGDDAWIIKALDHIASINEKAGGPEIAGINLSLGGEFEQGVFGCGHTPLCDELRRLWRQGVVVVLAAGNEGFRRLMSTDGDFGANIPCSIGDPANLDEAIAVGAVHKEKPHTYGVSHFSSRGPTADGRMKPDCVAPGEQILSCRHDPPTPAKNQAPSLDDLYYKLDGTSMAAPHVSGLLACYLSNKSEFIGQPDKVKRILLKNCTDLERDRDLQGAGLPNLVKMLVQS